MVRVVRSVGADVPVVEDLRVATCDLGERAVVGVVGNAWVVDSIRVHALERDRDAVGRAVLQNRRESLARRHGVCGAHAVGDRDR